MSIRKNEDLQGMLRVSRAVALTLREMKAHVRPGMTTRELDNFGGALLKKFGARSAPALTYKFPGHTCISLNHEIAHGIPGNKIIREGDLLNIDVSAELAGYWSDNGGSMVVGDGHSMHRPLVQASRDILNSTIRNIRHGVRISDSGGRMEREARARGFKVIRNLTGHGIGKRLHEAPHEIANYDDGNRQRFTNNLVVAIETFISTASTIAETLPDGWTLVGNRGGFVAQHEHTIMVTEGEPLVLTAENGN